MRTCSLLIEQFRSANLSAMDLTNDTISILRVLDLDIQRRGSSKYLLVGMDESEGSSAFARFLLHRQCLNELEMTSQGNNCVEISRGLCDVALNPNNASGGSQRTLIAVKVIRTGLGLIEETLRNNPDLSVIHLVRDPRAMAASRYKSQKVLDEVMGIATSWQSSVAHLARMLCVRVLEDLRVKKRLEATYPGAVMTVKYEDFVTDPHSTATKMFEHVGHRVDPELLDRWIKTHVSSSSEKKDDERFDIIRKNPQSHVSRWRREIDRKQLRLINEDCRHVLDELNYPL